MEEGEPINEVALELNYNYISVNKISQDLIKLIDPKNDYACSIYLVFGERSGFKDAVEHGIEEALKWVQSKRNAEFLLPPGLKIFVIENQLGQRVLWEGKPSGTTTQKSVEWISSAERELQGSVDRGWATGAEEDLLTYEQAKNLLVGEMRKAGIPLGSKTARKMFKPTKDGKGRNRCNLGPTPLWKHRVPKVGDHVRRGVFMDWVQRLIDSGRSYQKRAKRS
jgi:hypothetical protein